MKPYRFRIVHLHPDYTDRLTLCRRHNYPGEGEKKAPGAACYPPGKTIADQQERVALGEAAEKAAGVVYCNCCGERQELQDEPFRTWSTCLLCPVCWEARVEVQRRIGGKKRGVEAGKAPARPCKICGRPIPLSWQWARCALCRSAGRAAQRDARRAAR